MLIINGLTLINSECPKINEECSCTQFSNNDISIDCYGYNFMDSGILTHIFYNLSQTLPEGKKHFTSFTLSNPHIIELGSNTFSDITFDKISIYNSTKLTSIDANAFNGTDMKTKELFFIDTPLVEKSNNDIVNSIFAGSFFTIVSKFTNLEFLSIENSSIEVIPSYAFSPINGYQNKLNSISITGSLKQVMNNAFYNLDSLSVLTINDSTIDILHSDAFRFRNSQFVPIVIGLNCHLFNASNIEENALTNITRPVVLLYQNEATCKLTYLDEKTFAPFFDSNIINSIFGSDLLEIDCDDCRSHWIKKNANYTRKLKQMKCTNGKKIEDVGSFSKCN